MPPRSRGNLRAILPHRLAKIKCYDRLRSRIAVRKTRGPSLARRLPSAEIHAYDIDPAARTATSELAAMNAVDDRVEIMGHCSSRDLESLPPRSVVIVDCEGAEKMLIT